MAETHKQNHVLFMLTDDDKARLRPHLVPIAMPLRMVLESPHEPVQQIYFPKAGLVSVVLTAGPREQAETGVIGYDGVTGHSVISGDGRSPVFMYMQIAGHGMRMSADELRRQMADSVTLVASLNRFLSTFTIQASFTALANSRATLDRRLTRWLMMAHDRLDGDTIDITHESLSILLGVRRSGVTVMLHNLAVKGFIETERASIQILDHGGLASIAGNFYGGPEAELARLIGWRPAGRPPHRTSAPVNEETTTL